MLRFCILLGLAPTLLVALDCARQIELFHSYTGLARQYYYPSRCTAEEQKAALEEALLLRMELADQEEKILLVSKHSFQSEAAIPHLLALYYKSPQSRGPVTRNLSLLARPGLKEHLYEIFRKHLSPDDPLLARAIRGMAGLAADEAWPAIRASGTCRNEEICAAIFYYLQSTGNPELSEAAGLALGSSSSMVKTSAYNYLRSLPEPRAHEILVQAFFSGLIADESNGRAAILTDRQALFSRPDFASRAVATLARGSMLEIRNVHKDSGMACRQECNWLEVMTFQGNTGWIPARSALFLPGTGE